MLKISTVFVGHSDIWECLIIIIGYFNLPCYFGSLKSWIKLILAKLMLIFTQALPNKPWG